MEATDSQLLNVERDWRKKSSNKKDWRNYGNLEKPGPLLESGQREHDLIWKRRLTEEQADKPRGWRGSKLCGAECKLKQLSKTKQRAWEREKQTDRVTVPSANQLFSISWDGHFFYDYWALIGHKERHRLPYLRGTSEKLGIQYSW